MARNSVNKEESKYPDGFVIFGASGCYVSRIISNYTNRNMYAGKSRGNISRATPLQGPMEDNGDICSYKQKNKYSI